MSFPKLIRHAMDKYGTRVVATGLGVTPRTLQRWANGSVIPNEVTKAGAKQIINAANKRSK